MVWFTGLSGAGKPTTEDTVLLVISAQKSLNYKMSLRTVSI